MAYVHSKGATLKLATYAAIQLTSIGEVGQAVGLIDITNLGHTRKTYLAGLADGNEVSIAGELDPTDTHQHIALLALATTPSDGVASVVTITEGATSYTFTFTSILTNYTIAPIEQEDVVRFTATLKINSDVVFAVAV